MTQRTLLSAMRLRVGSQSNADNRSQERGREHNHEYQAKAARFPAATAQEPSEHG